MRRILINIPHRRTTIVSSFCNAGGSTLAASFLTAGDVTDPNLEKLKPRTFVKVEEEAKSTDIFGVSVRKQLKKEERARKALGILFRGYGGRSTRDDDDELANLPTDPEEKVDKTKDVRKITYEELNVFLINLSAECEPYEKYVFVREVFLKEVIEEMNQDDELGDANQNDRVDKLAEIAAQEELDAFVTNLFTTKLMIECEPKYGKRFRQVIEKVRKKMIRDDTILKDFELLTNLMIEIEPEDEQLLSEGLEKVCAKITQDDEVVGKIGKIDKLAKKVENVRSFEGELDKFVTNIFIRNLRDVEEVEQYFMAYEVIEKVAKEVGIERVGKIAEGKIDALVTNAFANKMMDVLKRSVEGSWKSYLKVHRMRLSVRWCSNYSVCYFIPVVSLLFKFG